MKIPHDHPVAQASIQLAQQTLDSRDPRFRHLFKDATKLIYDIYARGAVSIGAPVQGGGKVTLSMAGYFAKTPVIAVTPRQVRVGKDVYAFKSSAAKDLIQLVAEASPRR